MALLYHGIIKQVYSGDMFVIRDKPRDSFPTEIQLSLSNIACGKLARKPTASNPGNTSEDPYAWEAREFMRKKLIGKQVVYTVENELPSGKKYGTVYLGSDVNAENVAITLVEHGLAEVRKTGNASVEKLQLITTEEEAKNAGRGRWSSIEYKPRTVVWSLEDVRAFFEQYKGQELKAVVENVRDGSSIQMTLIVDEGEHTYYYNIMSILTGIRAPGIHTENSETIYEPHAQAAKFFVESRILHRDVTFRVESLLNQQFVGTVLHPNGNIAQMILNEGLAKCVEWNLGLLLEPGLSATYRSAEQNAKNLRKRLWENHVQEEQPVETVQTRQDNRIIPSDVYNGVIMEVGNGDNVTVKCTDGIVRKFFLSSIRLPRAISTKGTDDNSQQKPRIRPLYDVPHVFEARELLRQYVSENARIHVDTIQPKSATLPDDRIYCTVNVGDKNLAEQLVQNGLASVIRYPNSAEPRSPSYASLFAAEESAKAKSLGLFGKQDAPSQRVMDITSNPIQSRQLFPFLQRAKHIPAIVEYVMHARGLRVYLPNDMRLLSFMLAGVQCPRKARPGYQAEDMPFSDEAHAFTRETCMQRDVVIEVETVDRAGNFVGWVFIPENSTNKSGSRKSNKKKKNTDQKVGALKNVSALMIEQGLGVVQRSSATERSRHFNDLLRAEEVAKSQQRGIWTSEDLVKQLSEGFAPSAEVAPQTHTEESTNIKAGEYIDDFEALNLNGAVEAHVPETKSHKFVQITALSRAAGAEGLRFFTQNVSDSRAIIEISELLNSQQPPLLPGYQPRKGEMCAACFSVDNRWYRAKVLRQSPKASLVRFVEFGNEETIPGNEVANRLAPLPSEFLATAPPLATEYRLTLIQLPPDDTDRMAAQTFFSSHIEGKEVKITIEHGPTPCAKEAARPVPSVTLTLPPIDSAGSSAAQTGVIDIGEQLLSEGLVFVEPVNKTVMKQVPQDLYRRYLKAQNTAKSERKNIWQFGDFRNDDQGQ